MIEQAPVTEPEPKPEEPKPVNDDPPPPLGTNITGDGAPDGFGLSGTRGNGAGNGRGLGGGRAASRWGWYAGKVQATLAETLRRNPRTREAVLNGKLRIWPDSTGRITRATLADSSGDSALETAIAGALTGVQLPEPPPAGMPSPILLRLSSRRP
jgi:protein TonB